MKAIIDAAGRVHGWAKARAAGSGSGALAAALTQGFAQGFDWAYAKAVSGMPGLDSAEDLAASYAARHASVDEAVKALLAWHVGMAGAAGFVTGCGGFVSLPVAIPANLASALFIQVRLIAAIAHLRGHDIHSAEVRALVMACLTGSKAADTLKDAGVRFGTRVTRDVVGWVSPALISKVRHAATTAACGATPAIQGATQGAAQTTGQAVAVQGAVQAAGRLGRLVPLVGGLVAGGFDAAMTQLIGRTADRVFSKLTLSRTAA